MFELAYHRPETLEDARQTHAQSGEAMYLSGGHTLVPALKSRLLMVEDLVDLRAIPGLRGIVATAADITIGATTPHADVAKSSEVGQAIPALAGLAGSIGDRQVRNVGTIGGSLANNDPAADYPSAVLALDATVETDARRIPSDDYFTGLYETALEPGEIVTRVVFPVPRFAAYAKMRSAASRYSIVGVFLAELTSGAIRVAVTGAGENGVFRCAPLEQALEAGGLTVEALDGVTVEPEGLLADSSASSDYRAHLIVALARQALATRAAIQVLA